MLVYDITNEKSFDNIRNWMRNIEEVRAALSRTSWSSRRLDSQEGLDLMSGGLMFAARIVRRGENASGE